MPYNLWMFPLLSGFYFLTKYGYNKYNYQRIDTQKIILQSVIYGVFIFFITYSIRICLSITFPKVIPAVYNFMYKLPVSKQELLWTSIMCFLLTVTFINTANFILKKYNYFSLKTPVISAIDKIGDEVEQLFKQSFVDKLLIQITLKNNKVYVGFADSLLPPKDSNYLKIVPLISGFRKSDTKEIEFTTDYLEALSFYQSTPNKFNRFGMDVIVMQNEILTAQIFDLDIYKLFNYQKNLKSLEGANPK